MFIRNFIAATSRFRLFAAVAICLFLSSCAIGQVRAADGDEMHGGRLVTIYDRGQKRVVLTQAKTISGALNTAAIKVSTDDVVEPKQTTPLVARSYTINIYRARPVIVVDGPTRQKIMTAAQTPEGIAAAAHMTLLDDDDVSIEPNQNIVADGAGVVLTIDRATQFTLKLYGKEMTTYTQAKTVGEMLKQKDITLSAKDTVSKPVDMPVTSGMTIEVWREGVQTVTIEEGIAFPVRTVFDADQAIGQRTIQIPGTPGKKNVAYEITAQGGREVARRAIQSVVVLQPKEQVEVVGTKPKAGSLTKSKGAQMYTDNNGVVHRETYYDLPMNIVMGACGGGGYTIRADGAKVDKDGYVLIAANLGNYPRCSVVDTSMGPGKVYDTGGFATKHPHGFDLATDWTNGDGR